MVNGNGQNADSGNSADLKPELVDGKYSIRDLVDIERLHRVFEKFSDATGFTVGLLEYPSYEILISTGWRDICTKFHRSCAGSSQHCKTSNQLLFANLTQSRQISIQPCENGMVDGATPIIIRGKCIAFLATGQALLSPPDEGAFKERAALHGFDEKEYLEALRKVPVVSESQFRKALEFLSEMAVILAEMGLKTLEIKERSDALEAEKEHLAVTLASIADGVIVTDATGRITVFNKIAEEMTGWRSSEATGEPLEKVFKIINERTREICENPVTKVLREQIPVNLANHTVLIAKDGRERIIADSGAPILDGYGRMLGVVLVFRDTTKSRQLEEEIAKNLKLESLGLLAGGIAHDFNNILTCILGNASAIRLDNPQLDNETFTLIDEVERAALRAKDLTQQLLSFSRGGTPVKKTADLKEAFMESARFALRGSQSRCEFDIAQDLWRAEVDVGQISQVIHNLVINASQSMPGGGIIRLGARNLTVYDDEKPPLQPGRYLDISISDTGTGIPSNLLDKIFDPYFTTKNKGRGLGLFTVFTIVKNHNGYIKVNSRTGSGTTFHIFIPATLEEPKAGAQAVPGKPAAVARNGRILIMDDDDMVRRFCARILQKAGYQVVAVIDGTEAVLQYHESMKNGTPFNYVLLDMTVPGGMGGKETFANLKQIDPKVKAIASSGYSNDPVISKFEELGFAAAVGKPYRAEDLLGLLDRLNSESVEAKT